MGCFSCLPTNVMGFSEAPLFKKIPPDAGYINPFFPLISTLLPLKKTSFESYMLHFPPPLFNLYSIWRWSMVFALLEPPTVLHELYSSHFFKITLLFMQIA